MALVRSLSLVVAMLACLPWAAGAQQTLNPADRSAIRSVIEQQMDAFRRDDGVEAFSYAAPSIRSLFGTPERFMDMVRSGYQPVYRPRSVQFRKLAPLEGNIVQQVYVVGPDGVPKLALYTMERQPDNSWRIAGCVLLEFESNSI